MTARVSRVVTNANGDIIDHPAEKIASPAAGSGKIITTNIITRSTDDGESAASGQKCERSHN